MELTMGEKEMLVLFGCEKRKLTHERWGIVCITDVLMSIVVNNLWNKIYKPPCDKWYIDIYNHTIEELKYPEDGDFVA